VTGQFFTLRLGSTISS